MLLLHQTTLDTQECIFYDMLRDSNMSSFLLIIVQTFSYNEWYIVNIIIIVVVIIIEKWMTHLYRSHKR